MKWFIKTIIYKLIDNEKSLCRPRREETLKCLKVETWPAKVQAAWMWPNNWVTRVKKHITTYVFPPYIETRSFLTQVKVHYTFPPLDFEVVLMSADNHAQCTHKHSGLYFNMSLKPILQLTPIPQPLCAAFEQKWTAPRHVETFGVGEVTSEKLLTSSI